MKNQFTEKSLVQEVQYKIPYHWNWVEGSEEGRRYWCYVRRVKELLFESIEDSNEKRHVDLGCGDGRVTAFLGERMKVDLYGSDFSEKALRMADAIVGDTQKITWFPWNIMEVSEVYENFFDSATLVEVVEHIPLADLPIFLKNVNTVLRSNGVLVLCTPSVLDTKIPDKHYQHFTPEMLGKLLDESGFIVDVIEGQDKKSTVFDFLYKTADNRYWAIKPLKKFLNTVFYRKFFDRCSLETGRRLVVRAIKK